MFAYLLLFDARRRRCRCRRRSRDACLMPLTIRRCFFRLIWRAPALRRRAPPRSAPMPSARPSVAGACRQTRFTARHPPPDYACRLRLPDVEAPARSPLPIFCAIRRRPDCMANAIRRPPFAVMSATPNVETPDTSVATPIAPRFI